MHVGPCLLCVSVCVCVPGIIILQSSDECMLRWAGKPTSFLTRNNCYAFFHTGILPEIPAHKQQSVPLVATLCKIGKICIVVCGCFEVHVYA